MNSTPGTATSWPGKSLNLAKPYRLHPFRQHNICHCTWHPTRWCHTTSVAKHIYVNGRIVLLEISLKTSYLTFFTHLKSSYYPPRLRTSTPVLPRPPRQKYSTWLLACYRERVQTEDWENEETLGGPVGAGSSWWKLKMKKKRIKRQAVRWELATVERLSITCGLRLPRGLLKSRK